MLNLSDTVNEIINKFSSIKFFGNPFNVSILLTIVILLIFIYASEEENPKTKMLFWSFIVITPLIFVHDKILTNKIKEESKTALGMYAVEPITGNNELNIFGVKKPPNNIVGSNEPKEMKTSKPKLPIFMMNDEI